MYVARVKEIVPSLIKRNTGEVAILLGDKGYDDQKIRALVREKDIRLLIKHREFSPVHKAGNARLDADLYGQRSQNETVNSRLKRKYGALIRSRAIDPSRGTRVALSPLKW